MTKPPSRWGPHLCIGVTTHQAFRPAASLTAAYQETRPSAAKARASSPYVSACVVAVGGVQARRGEGLVCGLTPRGVLKEGAARRGVFGGERERGGGGKEVGLRGGRVI